MKRLILMCFLGTFLAAGCGDTASKAKKNPNANNQNNVNNTNNETCGDGVLQDDEYCDPQIIGGEGSCPDRCTATSCATVELVGKVSDCTARCVETPAACAGGDSCCPAGCDSTNDPDCTNTCGNCTVEPPETCDGDCLGFCDDADACTIDTGTGNAETCSIVCDHRQITSCAGGDGCCPDACDETNDSDCANPPSCGNGEVEPGELCDGDCPTSCVDNDACTTDAMAGSASTCNVVCSNTAITSCISGDGCCPGTCNFQTDNDCACIPMTCQQLGKECGNHPDGCGGTVACGGCPANEVCSPQGICEADPMAVGTGSPCTGDPDCASATNAVLCQMGPDWPGGYCTTACLGAVVPCGDAGQCVTVGGGTLCMKPCNDISDCRQGYDCISYSLFDGGTARVCAGGP